METAVNASSTVEATTLSEAEEVEKIQREAGLLPPETTKIEPEAEASIQRVKYPPLKETSTYAPMGNIDYIKDVNLEASVELGNTNLTVEKILNLGVGAVVELAQTVGEPVRLVINHNLYALGEVVVIGDKFGIRITKLVRNA
jgi:flagellar motor switch protein FliN/FliY